MDNTFGKLFRATTFGESHGGAVGVVVDGCLPGIKLDLQRVQDFLNRRRPGQSNLTSPRQEPDQIEVLSGLENNHTLGTPLCLIVRNKDKCPDDYNDIQKIFRPSHADFTTLKKFGIKSLSGGGRASARETIGRVAAAAIAEQCIEMLFPATRVVAWVDQVKTIQAGPIKEEITRTIVDQYPMRCPDDEARPKMEALILATKKSGDSIGGVITCRINHLPAGLGAPVFDKLEAELAAAMMSLPASKGFEIGSGFGAVNFFGSEHNDSFVLDNKNITTATNHSGGIQGGISTGQTITCRIAFKPVSTIFREQKTVTLDGNPTTFKPKAGRHDPCVLPRAVPIVEAMALLVLIDQILRQRALRGDAWLCDEQV